MSTQLTSQQDLKQSKYNPISFYGKLTDRQSDVITFEEAFEMIRSGRGFLQTIQKLREETNRARLDDLKKSLPAITVSGLFGEARKIEHLKSHSGFIQLDFDNVQNLKENLEALKGDEYSFAVFISPSGKGIKLIVKIPPNPETHRKSFTELSSYYFSKYKLEADQQCKDITRLLFLSWDKDLFVNVHSECWKNSNNQSSIFETVLDKLKQKEVFTNGKRNDFVYKLACECVKAKIDVKSALVEIIDRFSSIDFPSKEIESTIKSAYNKKQIAVHTLDDNNSTSGTSTLRRAEIYLEKKYEIRLNEVNGRIEYRERDSDNLFTELKEANIFRELHHANIPLSILKICTLLQSDFVSKYNPFLNYFEHLGAWDKNSEVDYIENLCEYLPIVDMSRFKIQLKKWLVRSIACALDDNVLNKQALVLVGEGQNTGKSTFCRWLCPTDLIEYFTESITLDKDGIIALSSNFIINLDELTTLSKSDINSLKSFISKDRVALRLPYAKRSSTQPRRANFIGSTNNDEFLVDETGNVRWQCFEVIGKIDFDYKRDFNINDIWRQAYSLYKEGFIYQLTVDELKENEKANSKYLVDSIESQLIQKYFEPSNKDLGEFMQSNEILERIIQKHPHVKSNIRNIGRALKILGFKRISNYISNRGYSVHGYFVCKNCF